MDEKGVLQEATNSVLDRVSFSRRQCNCTAIDALIWHYTAAVWRMLFHWYCACRVLGGKRGRRYIDDLLVFNDEILEKPEKRSWVLEN